MAEFRTYKCNGCDYSVQTDPKGHYSLMSGEFYNFKCGKCKTIVSISAYELAKACYFAKCPRCGESGHLSTWNPLEGHCPKCNRKMSLDPSGGIIMAD